MTILATGFAAFPGAPYNPTAMLTDALRGTATARGEAIETAVLPVEWSGSWPALEDAIEAFRPRAVVLIGLHAGAARIRLELLARNVCDAAAADAAGACAPRLSVIEGGEAMLAGRWPVGAIAAALRAAGIAFEWSRDAGRYLCNASYYRLAREAAHLGVETFGFVHVPLSDESLAAILEAGETGAKLPDSFRTVSAEQLRRAAVAILETI